VTITVGIYDVEPSFATIIDSVFDAAGTVARLPDPSAVEAFVSDRQFPNIKLLAANLENLPDPTGLWKTLAISITIPTFHLVLFTKDESIPHPLPSTSERVHIIDLSNGNASDSLLHHLRSIKSAAEAFGLKYNVLDIFVHEEIFAEEYDFPTKFVKLLEELGNSIKAQSIQVFLLQSRATGFRPVFQWGKSLYRSAPLSAFEKSFQFKNKRLTFRLQASQLRPLEAEHSEEGTPDFAVLSSFALDTVPGFVLYTFENGQSEDLLWETCSISSWEIFHLLSTYLLLLRYKTLVNLAEIQQFNLGRKDVLHHILDCLQRHFKADGVSIIEYRGAANNTHKFEKHHKHYGNYGHRVFSINYGFTHKCVVEKKAFVITKTFITEPSKKFGMAKKTL
jgi:hypothetical protein